MRHQQGFTILEILVAFVIATLAIGTLMQIFSTGMRNVSVTGDYARATELARSQLEQSAEVTAALGQPLSTGTPTGSIQIAGPDGRAHLQFEVEGPNGQGTAYVEAVKELGRWRIERMAVDDEASGRRIDLTPAP